MNLGGQATAAEWLADWDRGEIVYTISMGGLGPGYEQALQLAAVAFVRAGADFDFDAPDASKRWEKVCDGALSPINERLGGLSGAQFGAAAWLAAQLLQQGPQKLMETFKAGGQGDRIMMISSRWPADDRVYELLTDCARNKDNGNVCGACSLAVPTCDATRCVGARARKYLEGK